MGWRCHPVYNLAFVHHIGDGLALSKPCVGGNFVKHQAAKL